MTSMATATQATALAELAGENSVEIQVPPQKVYDYLLDFTRHPEWVLNVSKVTKLSSGPVAAGTKFRTVESAPPAPMLPRLLSMVYFVRGILSGAQTYSEAEITALEAGRRIAWTGRVRKGDGVFNAAQWEIVLEPSAAGTRLTQRFRYLPQSDNARRMLSALGDAQGLKTACAKSLMRLKGVLERAPQV